jgi:multiple sugar transport system ATP-binding protein
MKAIQLRDVRKTFDKTEILKGIDLEIESGEFCVFVGPSGCGKSTLLRLIAGLEEVTSGELYIAGKRMNDVPPADRGVAMVFQSYALYPHMTVRQNLAFGLKLARTDKAEIARRVQEAARMLQIEELLDRLPRQLSGGQRQRVAIGRAITRNPQIFLFDEPLSNLDAALRVQTRIEIYNLYRTLRATTVYVTHDQVEAMTLADKIVILNKGQIVQVGAPMELYHRPRNRFAAGFIGSPTMNFIEAELEGAGPAGSSVRLRDGSRLELAVDASSLARGERVTVGIRPEHVRLSAGEGEGNALRGQVIMVEKLGGETVVYLRTPVGATPLTLRCEGDLSLAPDTQIGYHLPAAACHLFDGRDLALPRAVPPAAAEAA